MFHACVARTLAGRLARNQRVETDELEQVGAHLGGNPTS